MRDVLLMDYGMWVRAQAMTQLKTFLWVPEVLFIRQAEAPAPGPREDSLTGVQCHRVPAPVLRGREFQ